MESESTTVILWYDFGHINCDKNKGFFSVFSINNLSFFNMSYLAVWTVKHLRN